ncbi:MAG TPA: alcohol dehydrogenase catalytic domain-containing protein [Propionibacteriaceae bacterium]|nr:alcohol dehydrogenase catalytic domain-containing protein [Propionibacteriaceae bacterium]
MRAFVVTSPGQSGVYQVDPPQAAPGQVVVDVERVGVCGTDVEFFTGEMEYLLTGQESFPLRLGHEWCGRISAVGEGVDPALVGRRTTGDTMLGCQQCERCRSGLQHLCTDRYEIGIRHGWPGALAEQLPVPAWALHLLPDSVDTIAGALVEPGGNALRAVRAAALSPGNRVLILGPGTIGLLAAMFAVAAGAEVHLMGVPGRGLEFARSLSFAGVWTREDVPDLPYHAVIDASNSPELPALAVQLVEPGHRVVYIGLAGRPSLLDARELTLKDVTAVGVLSASPGLAGAVEQYADGRVDPRPLVAATVGLEEVGAVLAGEVPADAGPGPKIQVDPRLR